MQLNYVCFYVALIKVLSVFKKKRKLCKYYQISFNQAQNLYTVIWGSCLDILYRRCLGKTEI